MRARLQGVVILECVVRPDGRCANVRVVRSLDRDFGLDQKAIEAAYKWRFRPGERLGEPVPVFVTLEMEFAIR
jgi:TonB family protein